MLLRVPSTRMHSDQAPPASLSAVDDAVGSDDSCGGGDYDLLTFKQRLQLHTRLLPFQTDRSPANQVRSSSHFHTATPFAGLTRKQMRFDTSLDCLRGLGVPITSTRDTASHVLCCSDEWQRHQGQHHHQQAQVIIDALHFSLDPPYKLYQTLLP